MPSNSLLSIKSLLKFRVAGVITLLIILTSCGKTNISAISGKEAIDGPIVAVKIDDTPPAHPQIGIDKANLIYIEQVEGG